MEKMRKSLKCMTINYTDADALIHLLYMHLLCITSHYEQKSFSISAE